MVRKWCATSITVPYYPIQLHMHPKWRAAYRDHMDLYQQQLHNNPKVEMVPEKLQLQAEKVIFCGRSGYLLHALSSQSGACS